MRMCDDAQTGTGIVPTLTAWLCMQTARGLRSTTLRADFRTALLWASPG